MILELILFHFIFVGADISYPPCVFNSLCTCSRSDTNLGIVNCVDIILHKVPLCFNYSKVNSLNLDHNGLKMIEPFFFFETGLHILKISRNPLHVIDENLLKGLESSLRELEISYANLIEVPIKSLKSMEKLQILNLSGNDITDVGRNNWINIRNTLEILILKENAISYLPANAFERFLKLRTLDLSKNVLIDIDPDAFFPETMKLTYLYLAHNQLKYIPYAQLQYLRSLKLLDLSHNFISKVSALSESTGTSVISKLSLNFLHLEYNNIKYLFPEDFQKFHVINETYFDGNPITTIQNGTFLDVHINELSFSACGLSEFNSNMIHGLEKTLTVLDLSNNNLHTLDKYLLQYFSELQELKILGNKIQAFSIPDFNGNLLKLEIGCDSDINIESLMSNIGSIKSLIRISISNVEINYIASDHFSGYGFGVEELSIINANLKNIYAQAFIYVRGIKRLDFSNNVLCHIHDNAFAEVGHSLNFLYLTHAFAKSVKTFPSVPMQNLKSLQLLDISHNAFEELPANSFHSMHHLEIVRVHDCKIEILKRDTFQNEIHVHLKEVSFSFNRLQIIKSFTFTDLSELRYVNFEDNMIRIIETKAFNDLKNLKWIYLRGNEITTIEMDAFANLPELELLDLAFNNLKNFDFITLDQMVGASVFLSLNLSFNHMNYLHSYSADLDTKILPLNIKILDLSHNNITDIANDYFEPLEFSLTHLYLSNNQLLNISKQVFGNLEQLQRLDFSFNKIHIVEYDIFRETHKIQILNLSYNNIYDLPQNLFHGMKNLRIIDLSDNYIKFLPEFSFREDCLESILLARNQFGKIPFTIFTPEVAASLKELDLSFNRISTVHAPELISHFKSLILLNIAGNELNHLEDSVFYSLANLIHLDLSHNFKLKFTSTRQIFNGLQESLLFLGLQNVSLTTVPDLPLSKLIYLQLSNNNLTSISAEAVMNLTSIRLIDLSCNHFASIPKMLLSMKDLKILNLSQNYIRILDSKSLLSGFEQLRELDISNLPLEIFETGTMTRLISLVTLHISTYKNIIHFNIPKIIENNYALQNLYIDVQVKTLHKEMLGFFPKKLRNIIFYGAELENVDSKIFTGITSAELFLTFKNTNVGSLDKDLFKNIPLVRNISLNVKHNLLKYISNPSTEITLDGFDRTFLINLKLADNLWNCKCDIGWIETWARFKRQIFCRHIEMAKSKSNHDCLKTEDDLRLTFCSSKQLLLTVMKTDLECGWNNSSCIFPFTLENILLLTFVCIINYMNIVPYQYD